VFDVVSWLREGTKSATSRRDEYLMRMKTARPAKGAPSGNQRAYRVS
jgi:hypothetical protein